MPAKKCRVCGCDGNLPVLIYVTRGRGKYLARSSGPALKGGYQLYSDERDIPRKWQALNGFAAFECRCSEAFGLVQEKNPGCEPYGFPDCYVLDHPQAQEDPLPDEDEMGRFRIIKRSGLSNYQLNLYGKGKRLHACHFESVRAIEPLQLTELYWDSACTQMVLNAPQSFCYVYRKMPVAPYVQKCVLVSIHSKWVMELANHSVDRAIFPKVWEIRTQLWKGVEEK
jgi:hypothetical protein